MTERGAGDNVQPGGIAADALKGYIERIERLNGEKAELQADIKGVFQEAKSSGFDPKVIRAIIRERSQDKSERQEFEALCELYRRALGDFGETELGDAAAVRLAKGR